MEATMQDDTNSRPDDSLPTITASELAAELAAIERMMRRAPAGQRPWTGLTTAAQWRVVDLYTLYLAKEMAADAAAVFERVVAGNAALSLYLAPVGDAWRAPLCLEEPEIDPAEVDAAFERFMKSVNRHSSA
jgi:hypothetical protein